MPRNYIGAPEFAAPVLAHTLTPSAEAARAAVRASAIDVKVGKLVTKVGPKPEVERGPVPASAARLLALAQRVGFDPVALVHGHVTLDAGKVNERRVPAVQVAGRHAKRRVGFRATWAVGKAHVGVWYEPNVTPRTGVAVGVAEVTKRVEGTKVG